MKTLKATAVAKSAMVALVLSLGASFAAQAKTAVKADVKAQEQTKSKAKASKKANAKNSKLSRDIVFDGSVVKGKYLSAGEAVSTVESEKTLDNLIGVRTDFKDRLAAERQRLKSGAPSKN